MKINGKQSVKLRSGSIKFKNYFTQLAASLKIYTDFESVLRRTHVIIEIILQIMKNIRNIFFAVLLAKLYVLMINLANQTLFTEEKIQSINYWSNS